MGGEAGVLKYKNIVKQKNYYIFILSFQNFKISPYIIFFLKWQDFGAPPLAAPLVLVDYLAGLQEDHNAKELGVKTFRPI